VSPVRRQRLDGVLVATGRAADLEEARSLVAAGRVLVAGAPALSSARAVAVTEPIEVLVPSRYVSRGGDKLAGALEAFDLDLAGALAVDVGASTGGFTDCLLQAGASRVLAVDVGPAQLHERLRSDPRVVVAERTNVRALDRAGVGGLLGGAPDFVAADVSFSSLASLAVVLVGLAGPTGALVVLVKPQFELDRVTASRGRGVIRDPDEWRDAVHVATSALRAAGAGIMGVVASPLRGAAGNVEFLVWCRVGTAGLEGAAFDEAVRRALEAVPA